MKLQVSGNINEYYVQTLCMLFFPGSKFSKNEKEDPFAPCADVCVENREACAIATVTLSHAGRTATATHKEPCDGAEKVSAERIACGKAFLEAVLGLQGAELTKEGTARRTKQPYEHRP